MREQQREREREREREQQKERERERDRCREGLQCEICSRRSEGAAYEWIVVLLLL